MNQPPVLDAPLVFSKASPVRETQRIGRPGLWFSWKLAALFALVAGVALFYRLGASRTLASHEVYAAVPARDMLATGDWIVPTFGGKPRLEKPPLVYWMHATVGRAFGTIDEFTLRLPAALFAVLLAVLMGVWGAKWYGRNAGWAAAFVQISSLYVLTYGRKAEVDMLVWLTTTAALFLVARQPADETWRRGLPRWTAIYALLSIAWLGKFHYGPAMFVAPTAVYFAVQGRWRAFSGFANPPGLLLFAAAVFVWPWLVLQQEPLAWEVWRYETVGRATGAIEPDPFWFYLPAFLFLLLPWSPFLIAAAKSSWFCAWRNGDPRERFLWAWFLSHLAIVSAQPDKHSHYIAAALPACTLIVARWIAGEIERLRDGRRPVSRIAAIAGTAVAVAAAVVGMLVVARSGSPISTWLYAIAATAAGGIVAALWLFEAGRPRGASMAVLSAFVGIVAIVQSRVTPQQDDRSDEVRFVRQIREAVGGSTPLVVYRRGQDALVYYLDRPVQRVESSGEMESLLNGEHRVLVVAEVRFAWELGNSAQRRVLRRMPDGGEGAPPPLALLEVNSRAAVALDNARRYAAAYCNPP